ncbi:hypothetical protein BWQ96_03396 [Gracilariopsis chorda]|uniref:Uncharacterized protein n=1 Tax=Gracilariopsis chorda TaxID=448386 RepID=A0A2V3IYV3_9FLOR|nr:hypothetical protein BWQ96_03396 [Gracilariopsis chorda]|eukprot:PXF46867.1 hypothetical protein BWQ96_03396 [Gracilariopsis chorda]
MPRRRGRQAAGKGATSADAASEQKKPASASATSTRTTRSNRTTSKKSTASTTAASTKSAPAARSAKPNATQAVVTKVTSLGKNPAADDKAGKKASAPLRPNGKPQSTTTKSRKRSASRDVEASAPPAKQQRVLKARTSRKPTRPVYTEVWKEVYLAGTEWDQINGVYKEQWDFDHLDESLTDGDLSGKKVHLFGATEPQLIMVDEDDTKGEVVPIPIIVAVVSDVAPPSTVGLKSVQRTTEDIVPMSKLRISWQAYAPPNVAFRAKFKPNVYVLKCNQRFVSLKPKGEEAVHKYDYVLPYFFHPDKQEDDTVDTVVQVLVELEGRQTPLMCEFDYELDELDEFVEETVRDNELDKEKHVEPLKTYIRESVRNMKMRHKAEKEEKKRRIDEMSKEELEGIRNMKLIKFYPQNEWPDVSKVKSRFINRYYGHASEIR